MPIFVVLDPKLKRGRISHLQINGGSFSDRVKSPRHTSWAYGANR